MTDLIPASALESHIAILGKTGSGKSNTAKVVAEKLMAAGERVCVLDPTDTWWGLRLTPKGKPSAFHPVIFGGAHADIPVAEQHGAVLAEAIGTSSDSAIIATRDMTVGQRSRFFTAFAQTLLRVNRGPLYLMIDEAHVFMPQGKTDVQGGEMLHAGNNLVSLGRSAGLRITLITQRPQKLAKDSLTQTETLVAMRVFHPLDRKAYEEWIGEQGDDPAKAKEVVGSLASLATGEAWVWSPQSHWLVRGKFPLASTFDSGKPPSRDEAAPTLAPLDTTALGGKMDAIRQQAVENDPKRLKARIAELERERAEERKHPLIDATAVESARAAGHAQGFDDGVTAERTRLRKKLVDFVAVEIGDTPAMPTTKPAQNITRIIPAPPPPPSTTEPKLRKAGNGAENVAQGEPSPSARKLVDVIVAAYPMGMSLEVAAKRAGLSKRSSAFRRYLSEAQASPRIERRDDGRWVATAADPSVTAPNGLEDFKRSLPPSPAKMLEVLQQAGGTELDRDTIADRAGLSRTSSGIGSGLRELAALGLIVGGPTGYAISPDFL